MMKCWRNCEKSKRILQNYWILLLLPTPTSHDTSVIISILLKKWIFRLRIFDVRSVHRQKCCFLEDYLAVILLITNVSRTAFSKIGFTAQKMDHSFWRDFRIWDKNKKTNTYYNTQKSKKLICIIIQKHRSKNICSNLGRWRIETNRMNSL